MSEDDRFRTAAAMSDGVMQVLKHDDIFGVFDRSGDIRSTGGVQGGLFHDGARFLSTLTLEVNEEPLSLLSSAVEDDGVLLVVDLTNSELRSGDGATVPGDTLHVRRSLFLHGAACFQRLSVRNYGARACDLTVGLRYSADYADIFEVRGVQRQLRGDLRAPAVDIDGVVLSYHGLDGVTRYSDVRFSPYPDRVADDVAEFRIRLEPQQDVAVDVAVHCRYDEVASAGVETYDTARDALRRERAALDARVVTVSSTSPAFNGWIKRAMTDLRMLMTQTPYGPYPYAGTPWYSTAFGRDGIITALQMLWIDPEIAGGVLRYLAARQASAVDIGHEAEPGKMLHETRRGEMAALGEVPFGLYYGSVDVTPLFVVLAGAYYRHSGDGRLVEDIWPQIEAALRWIDDYGDVDGDGFVEYAQRGSAGLVNQGWKDSIDSVFHADGSTAAPPIALCEVQGYVYAARRAGAELALMLGDDARAAELERDAEGLRARFNAMFWLDDIGTYALALDGEKHACRVRASNAGHCLYTGIADDDKAARLAATLMDETMFTGFGIRTISASEARYNPISYHNGSVWPHDCAMIAAGMARYGMKDEALQITQGLYAAGLAMDLNRMPELFCGFQRRIGAGPTQYPVSCAPQAWAAGSIFMLLGACLGLRVDGVRGEVRLEAPVLPEGVAALEITNLRVGGVSVDLMIQSGDHGAEVVVTRSGGDVVVTVAG